MDVARNGSGDLTTPLTSRHSSSSFATLSSKKRTFSRWQEEINDKSLTHRATKNTFDRIAGLIPDNVAPNVITAAGL
jgi:hypothetical protein